MPRKTRGRKNRRIRKTRRNRMRGGGEHYLSHIRIVLSPTGMNLLDSKGRLKTHPYVNLVKGEPDDDDYEYTVYDVTNGSIYGTIDNNRIIGNPTLGDNARLAVRAVVACATCNKPKELPPYFKIQTLLKSSEGSNIYLASGAGHDKEKQE